MANTPLISITNTFSTQGPNGATVSGANSLTGNNKSDFEQTFGASTTNGEADWAFAATTLDSWWIAATAACTVKINSSGSPLFTLTLAAGQIVYWDADSYAANNTIFANPFGSTAQTKIFVTCTAACTITGSALNTV